ncbi:MAG: phosphatidate cytidylyltransferase [Christensenellaceae bacterium]|jgi:phosphatidate cytidylyltransferase|nr:phosphatidate cytidylyltransferase [Christensenellaceae bacterium]
MESKLMKRVITSALLIVTLAVFLVMHVVHAIAFDFMIVGLSLLGTHEVLRLLKGMGRPTYSVEAYIYPVLLFLLVLLSQIWAFTALTVFLVGLGLMALLYVITLLFNLFVDRTTTEQDGFRQGTGMSKKEFVIFKTNNTAFTFLYPNFLLVFLYMINHINNLGFGRISDTYSAGYIALFGIILVFFITMFSDSAGYIFGSLIKGPKIYPKLSPKKTWSGSVFSLLGGIVGALTVYFSFAAIFPEVYSIIAWWKIMLIGLFGSVVSQAGDAFESFLKRRAGVDEAGNLLPGHGGMMDRIDGLIFSVPFVFICLLLML